MTKLTAILFIVCHRDPWFDVPLLCVVDRLSRTGTQGVRCLKRVTFYSFSVLCDFTLWILIPVADWHDRLGLGLGLGFMVPEMNEQHPRSASVVTAGIWLVVRHSSDVTPPLVGYPASDWSNCRCVIGCPATEWSHRIHSAPFVPRGEIISWARVGTSCWLRWLCSRPRKGVVYLSYQLKRDGKIQALVRVISGYYKKKIAYIILLLRKPKCHFDSVTIKNSPRKRGTE